MAKCELQPFAPFNEFAFNNCQYPILFAILRHYGQSPAALVLNEAHGFATAYAEEQGLHLLYCQTHHRRPLEVVLGTLGVAQRSIRSRDVLADVRAALDAASPVMLSLDRYHQRGALEYFGKRHHLHSVLAIGYDDERGVVTLLDDGVGADPARIARCELGYSDLRLAHEACLAEWPAQLVEVPTFVAFSATRRGQQAACVPELRAGFLRWWLEQRPLLEQGLERLQLFVECFAREAPAASTSPVALEVYHTMFRRMSELAHTHRVQLTEAFGAEHPLAPAALELAAAWSQAQRGALRLLLGGSRGAPAARVARLSEALQVASSLERRQHQGWAEAAQQWLAERAGGARDTQLCEGSAP